MGWRSSPRGSRVALDDAFKSLTPTTTLKSDYEFFEMLRNGGRRAMRNFLEAHFDDIGRRGTLDLTVEAAAEWA